MRGIVFQTGIDTFYVTLITENFDTKKEWKGGVKKGGKRQDFPCDLFVFEGYRYVHAVCM